MAKRKKLEELSLSELDKKLWTYFSKWIKLTKIGVKGTAGKCISCGKTIIHGSMDCDSGHYISRRYNKTKFEPDNVWPQCVHCNKYLYGNQIEFRKALVQKLGEERVVKLETGYQQPYKIHKLEYIEKIKYYKEQIKELENV